MRSPKIGSDRGWRSNRLLRALLCAMLMLSAPGFAADAVQQQMRQIEAALARLSQEQQSVYQQFQMVQALRRSEERQLLPLPVYGGTGTLPNYEDVKREEEARAQRVRQYQYELDRLYGRYRELEEQKRPLFDALSALAQQRVQEPAATRPPPDARALTPPPDAQIIPPPRY